jgi:hypothetical protein
MRSAGVDVGARCCHRYRIMLILRSPLTVSSFNILPSPRGALRAFGEPSVGLSWLFLLFRWLLEPPWSPEQPAECAQIDHLYCSRERVWARGRCCRTDARVMLAFFQDHLPQFMILGAGDCKHISDHPYSQILLLRWLLTRYDSHGLTRQCIRVYFF